MTDNPTSGGREGRPRVRLRARGAFALTQDIDHDQRDALVRSALADHGDSGITPRHTLFFFYGDGDHDDLNEVARRAGFLTRGEEGSTILETTMAVDEASFAATSAMMQSWAAAFQLDYDGWECAVVTN